MLQIKLNIFGKRAQFFRFFFGTLPLIRVLWLIIVRKKSFVVVVVVSLARTACLPYTQPYVTFQYCVRP